MAGFWSGLAALISALAVWVGAPAPVQESAPRLTAGAWTPPLPELRPAPLPTPAPALGSAPPPEVLRLPRAAPARPVCEWEWSVPRRAPDLAVLGRWQLEG
ncbi:hypothetical protein SAMN04488058_103195 [Deinococcus reticulitermitis]|uniref:Uncharacterized protein n=1 Tax=Deinococcus reticulitermitis TaxID=856736 RepID=A0A1H6VJQ0_9DEIO|nr:hypothetical protein [Deinococcus reticulitermitis]SEJ04879.1 hypothetical protein SAMN04488058_103195 [Deinococcus reticulitermitis]